MESSQPEIVKLLPGGQHEARLKGLAMAGYAWVCENSNEKVVSVQKSYAADVNPMQRVGASATEVFTITALEKGQATLRFLQLRGWEPGKAPREERVLQVLVS